MAAEPVVARWWRGVARPEQADQYEALLRTKVLPGIHRIPGYRGGYLFRRSLGDDVEFATLTLWESMAAVRAFAGEDPTAAVVPPEARRLLREWDHTVAHYSMIGTPADFLPGEGVRS
jgi:heme-degrading monooxygenase HmoA